MIPEHAAALTAQAGTAAIDAIIDTMERQTHKRRLHGSAPHDLAASTAWTSLYSHPFVEHQAGRSFERPGCATCFMQGTVATTDAERENGALLSKTCPTCKGLCWWVMPPDVGPAPAWHVAGACFECSSVTPPVGWSQAERRARAEAAANVAGSGLRGKIR